MLSFNAIGYYLQRTTDVLKARMVQRQFTDMQEKGETNCGCGAPLNATTAFRCLYCGLYLCTACAEKHFGLTREQYDASDREFPNVA